MTILEMSAGGAILIAVILMLRRALLNRLPKWTFLLLWGVVLCRLLVPFTLPSRLSVYTGAARIDQALQEQEAPPEPSDAELPVWIPPATVPGTFREDVPVLPAAPPGPPPDKGPPAPRAPRCFAGRGRCTLFFGSACLWSLRRFRDAAPVELEFLDRWREEHPTLRPVQIKVCGAVNAPLAYGLIRPVILLPQNTDWTDEGQLTCVLTHEYVHIRRGDLGWKLLLTAALCVHWFNPLVWVMYFRANRDLELACDEAVVRILGLDSRKGYAYALLSAAESGFSPLCLTYTTKNHMEERIRAIMKMKKRSLAAVLTAALLVAGVTAVFATSKAPPEDLSGLPPAVQANSDPKPAPGDTSVPTDRVHPAAPGDTSTPDDRVHPITGQPGDAQVSLAPPEDLSGLPSAVQTNSDPKPALGDKSASDDSRVHPAAPGDTSTPDGRVHPVTGQPGDAQVSFEVQAKIDQLKNLENRWGVPEGEIPEGTEFTVADFDDADALGKYLEATHGLYPGDYTPGRIRGVDGIRYIVQVNYRERAIRERLPDGVYPVNSKGETYGTTMDHIVVGYAPDLILVQATNGKTGYAFDHDMSYGGYPGEIITLEDARTYMEWLETQPKAIFIPVYDVDRDNIIGSFKLSRSSDMTPEEELKMVEDQMRQNMGLSEEEIAKQLEELKASRGWN